MGALRNGLVHAHCPGRFQVLPGKPLVIIDVAHNAAAARMLSENLQQMPCSGRTLAVFAVLQDKQIHEITSALAGQVDRWFVCDLPVARAASAARVKEILLEQAASKHVDVFENVASGFAAAQEAARENDRILLFGSFYTVSQALKSSDTLGLQAGF